MTVSLTKRPHLREVGTSDRLRGLSHQQVCNAVGAVAALVPSDDRRAVVEMLGLVAPVRTAEQPPRGICGTLNGRYRHVQLDEQPCRWCMDAWNAYLRKQGGESA